MPSEQHLRDVLNVLFTFVGVLTPEGVLTEVNRAALDRVGVRPEDVLGKPFDQTPWWSESALERDRLRQAIARAAKGTASRYDVTLQVVDGRPVVIDTMIAPVFDDQGRVTQIVASGNDVSEQRLAERGLRESEERLSLAMRAAGQGTWDVDVRTGQGLWSAQHFRLLGYEPPQQGPAGAATFEMWRSRLHPDDAERVLQAVRVAERDGSLYNPEYRIVRSDDRRVVWLSAVGRFLYEGGRPARFIGVVQDVTPRKLADEEIARLNRDLERRVGELQALLDVLPVGIGIARDPACERIDVNAAFARQLGVAPGANASLAAPPGQRPTTSPAGPGAGNWRPTSCRCRSRPAPAEHCATSRSRSGTGTGG